MKILSTIFATLTGAALASNSTTSGTGNTNTTSSSTTGSPNGGTANQGPSITINAEFATTFTSAKSKADAEAFYSTGSEADKLKNAFSANMAVSGKTPAVTLAAEAVTARRLEELEFYRELQATSLNWTIKLAATCWYPTDVTVANINAAVNTLKSTMESKLKTTTLSGASSPTTVATTATAAVAATTSTSGATTHLSGLWTPIFSAILAAGFFFNSMQF